MDPTIFITALLLGIALGLAAGLAVGRARGAREHAERHTQLTADTASAQARLEETIGRVAALDSALTESQRELAACRERLAGVGAELDTERKVAAERQSLLEQADERLRAAFATVSAEALRSNSRTFLDLAKASLGEFQKQAASDLEHRQQTIDDLVKPLHESLAKVDAKLHQVEKERVGSASQLTEQLRTLAVTTTNLERALRTPNVRGGWGEVQLRRVVEMAGMLDHCHFVEKRAATSDEGRFIPDLIIKLPGDRNIIVDAKVPYIAYREAVEATDDAVRTAKLKDHARQIREHITQLSSKRYWDQFQPAPEFVFMFLPGEGYFSAALQHDPALIEFGVGKRVIPASPLTLIALLRAVAYGWQQETVARNAQEVSDLGRELYERVRRMGDHFDDLAKGLTRAVDAYNRTVGTLESRVLVTARRFKDLGVAAHDPIQELSPVDQTPRALQIPEHDLLEELVSGEAVEVGEEKD
ncbi:MAG: DNA recombination protein RmuC [Vicinamibacterales bacterium]